MSYPARAEGLVNMMTDKTTFKKEKKATLRVSQQFIMLLKLRRIAVDVELIPYVLQRSLYNMKAALMNVQLNLIQKLMFGVFEQCHNTTETSKIICCAKVENLLTYLLFSNRMVENI